MDKNESDERIKVLGFLPQKENIYNKLLPYADKLDEESNKLFSDIKTNLVKSVLAREIRPGCAIWTSRLNKYIKIYGLKFSKEDHIYLIKLYYNLLTLPNLEPTRINKFAVTLTNLLKKRDLLTQDDLQLEWKPLYNLCVTVMEKSKSDIGMYRYYSTLETIVQNFIHFAKIYFPVSVTQEILDEFRPKLCPYSNMANAVEYLELFLPVVMKTDSAHIGYNLWFEEFMNLWEVCHNANLWENQMMSLMAGLANYNIGYINWEPYIPIMFVRFLRTLHLPVGYRQKQSFKLYKIDIAQMCLWIVCTLGGESQTAFFHLEKFMQILESYFHPANTGRWTLKIREFLRKISFYFVQRVHCERYKKPTWDFNTKKSFLLTDDDIDRFVNIMKPCVEQAIFSKQGLHEITLTLNYLSSLRPNIIVPVVLDKLYASMDSLTEPHKLTSSLSCVMTVSRYMVQGKKMKYPEGPTHVIPILTELLPGIDPNDMKKCFTTFNFIVCLCNMVPIVDSSEACNYYDDLTKEEHNICEASAGFEDFVVQFFDRLCAWIESNSLEFTRMEQTDTNNKSKAEALAESVLIHVTTALLMQCSTNIFNTALRKVYNFATSRIMELNISGKMMATLCHAFSKINPKETMKTFVPHLCSTIECLLDENDDVMNEERLNGELLYYMLLLSEVVDAQKELLNYIDRLMNILDRTLHIKSVEGSRMSAHMLSTIVISLSFTQPTEYRSINKSLDIPVKDFLTIRSWGASGDLKNLNIQWYLPGKEEIECVQNILNKYLIPEIEKLENYSAGTLKLTREDLQRSLKIVIAILGAQTVLPLWKEPALQLVDSCIEPWAFELIVGSPHFVTMPDGKNVRKTIADTICKVQRKIQEIDEGDTLSTSFVIQIYDILLFNKFRGRDFEMHWKAFHITKRTMEDRLHQKKMHLRHVLIDRVMLHQEFRNESRSCSFTETHKQILLALFELGTSRYGVIRSLSQKRLFAAVSIFPYSCTVLTPYIKAILQLDSTEHHEKFKGCLHILLGPKNSPIIARHDWNFIKEIWPTLIMSQPSEKISIINLMSALNDCINKYFPTIAINLEIPDSCLVPAYELVKNVPEINLNGFKINVDNSVDRLKLENEQRAVDYNSIMNLLLEAATNRNLHWRYHSMTLSMMQYLVHPDIKYNPNIVKFFLKSLINDSLRIRKIALKVVLFILIQNKPKFKKIVINPFSFIEQNHNKVIPGIRSDNMWLLYDSATAPKDAEEWNKPRYVHDQTTGFYTWAKKLEVYAPSNDQPSYQNRKHNLNEQEIEIHTFFKTKDNVDTLIKYWSLEERKGKDQFNFHRFALIKNLFKICNDEILDIFVPHLKELVSDTQEHNQRCAAELLAGIIRGSKHWNFDKVDKLWSILLPIMRTAFNNITDETLLDWGLCVAMSLESRDPNRHHWLLEFLISDPLAEQSSFTGCARIYMLQNALNQQSWRNSELINRILEYFKDHLSHPFQNVREKISSCLVSIFCKDIVFPEGNVTNCPRVGDFFAQIMPRLNILYSNTLMSLDHSNREIDVATKNLMSIDLSGETEKEISIRLFKIVAKYVSGSVARMNYSAVPDHYDILPLACVLQNNDTDDELKIVCSNFLAILGCTLILDKYVPAALEAAKKVAICPFWSARSVIAEFISVLVFHNMATFLTHAEWVLEIQKMVLLLLEDVQPEVRVQAGKVLSGLLHCQFLPKPMELLDNFKVKAKTKFKRSNAKKDSMKNFTNGALRFRHAGVLGLCAFISSHPYDVPDFLPDIFSELGPHLSDPQPIPATIHNTLGDFKRTHHDNWDSHKLKFTEEELSVLSDLTVPPSYYA